MQRCSEKIPNYFGSTFMISCGHTEVICTLVKVEMESGAAKNAYKRRKMRKGGGVAAYDRLIQQETELTL